MNLEAWQRSSITENSRDVDIGCIGKKSDIWKLKSQSDARFHTTHGLMILDIRKAFNVGNSVF